MNLLCSERIIYQVGDYKLYASSACVDIITKFTRKQTRKFKNRRWVKKYLKKYSYTVRRPQTELYQDNINMRLYGHPDMIDILIKEIEEKNKNQKRSMFYHQVTA